MARFSAKLLTVASAKALGADQVEPAPLLAVLAKPPPEPFSCTMRIPYRFSFVLPAALLLGACLANPELPLGGSESDPGSGGRTSGTGGSNIVFGGDGNMGGDTQTCEALGNCPEQEPPACGDGRINQDSESCDDKNRESGDGCTATCNLESNYVCPTPGKPCVSTVVCGDKKITGSETCDDGNKKNGDGCNETCALEDGYVCPFVGLKCSAAACGDGIVAGNEECDFVATMTGCTNCKIDDGYDCDASACSQTVCQNGVVERGEGCEDTPSGDPDAPFDGCYRCQKEPNCSGGTCAPVCGDGQRFAQEACDDGNLKDGDGCSSTCTVEAGFACTDYTGTPPSTIDLPLIIRDFVGVNRQASGATPGTWAAWLSSSSFHPDFNAQFGAAMRAMVKDTLGVDGRPQWNWVPYATAQTKPPAADTGGAQMPPTNLTQCSCGPASGDTAPDCTCSDSTVCVCDNPGARTWSTQSGVRRPTLSVPSRFAQWYSNDPTVNVVESIEVTLDRDVATGTYSFDSVNTTQNAGKNYMDPFGTGGQVAAGNETMSGCSPNRNVSWTTETHFWFEYAGGEKFDFAGDDDTWVFVNGQLVVDLGGLHGALAGSFTLDSDTDGAGADTADGSASFTMSGMATTSQYPGSGTVDLGLTVGGVYEVVMFQAERNQCGSNFKVTLKDFNRPKSDCKSTCGDGIVASDELCDDGVNDGAYGKCAPGCLSLGPYCGDGVEQTAEGEDCDDGVNLSTYTNDNSGCAPGCKTPPSCGDATVQSEFEDCDDGVNDGGYGECDVNCTLPTRCGDGITQKSAGEDCDDGNLVSGDGCSAACKFSIVK